MASKAIEKAFQRHERPQVPTKAALVQRALQDEKRKSIPPKDPPKEIRESPWKHLTKQGDLIQGNSTWSICIYGKQLVMVKETTTEKGRSILGRITTLSDHPHIATVKRAFELESSYFFQMEYARYTLEEVLNVHTPLQDRHIQVIASAIFSAIKHISNAGLVHNAISIGTIRFRPSGKPILANFEECTRGNVELTPNNDLESLGVVVLECMNGKPCEDLRDPVMVRRLRESNKFFGLENGEVWSGCQTLIDFLDNIFNKTITALTKLEKPHSYIEQDLDYGILIPVLELVPLECFALWRPAAVKS